MNEASASIATSTPFRGTGSPLPGDERLLIVDVLRGLAIGGIVLANTLIITDARHAGWKENASLADRVADLCSLLLVEGSFFPLFSLLFGLGFAIQMVRAEETGGPFIPRYLRRLGILMLIALLHWFLVWDAFILINYAALGVPLLLFRRFAPRTLLVFAAFSLAAQVGSAPLSRKADRVLRAQPASAPIVARDEADGFARGVRSSEQRTRRLSSGSYMDAVTERAERFIRVFSRPSRYYPWLYGSIFSMFLLGLAAGRQQILHAVPKHGPLLRRIMWAGLGIGLVGKVAALVLLRMAGTASYSFLHLAAYGAGRVGGPALSLFYASAVALWLYSPRGSRYLVLFASIGRLALSNYVFQSVVVTTVAYGYGFGLYRRLGIAEGMLLALSVFLLQVPLSNWWLCHFRFGPVEWLWRSLTYGRLQTFRRAT